MPSYFPRDAAEVGATVGDVVGVAVGASVLCRTIAYPVTPTVDSDKVGAASARVISLRGSKSTPLLEATCWMLAMIAPSVAAAMMLVFKSWTSALLVDADSMEKVMFVIVPLSTRCLDVCACLDASWPL
jgi:hypothetical protein